MRILVAPDIHENLDFLKYIFAVEDTTSFDHIVLLGDYFDPPWEVQLSIWPKSWLGESMLDD